MPVTLSAYALADEQELCDFAARNLPEDAAKLDRLRSLLNRATELVESYLDRHLVTRGELTEYHTLRCPTVRLLLLERPIISITSIHEDAARDYGALTELVAGTDYIAVNPKGHIIRVASSLETSWVGGFRAIKVLYHAGYATRALVPADIRHAFLEVCALALDREDRKNHSVQSWTDDAGNFTRVSLSSIPKAQQEVLYTHRRWWETTGERDAA